MNSQLKELIKLLIQEKLLHIKPDEIIGAKSKKTGLKTLRVFDFDDTLAKTNSRVGITEFDAKTGEQLSDEYMISPAEYAKFKKTVVLKNPHKRYEYDYREFSEVKNPEIIEWTFKILKSVASKQRNDQSGAPAVILTARGHNARLSIKAFLQSLDIDIPVITLNSSDPNAKSDWIRQAMIEQNIPYIEFFDDSELNVEAVKNLNNDNELKEIFGKSLKILSRLIQDK